MNSKTIIWRQTSKENKYKKRIQNTISGVKNWFLFKVSSFFISKYTP